MTVDLFSPEGLEDPYPLYETLRDQAPVTQLGETGIWLVTRHRDLVEAASKPDVFLSHISAIFYAGEGTNPVVIAADPDAIGAVDVLATQDPPAHRLQRKLIDRAFTASAIASLERDIRAFTVAALDGAGSMIEWMDALANPLPIMVIGSMLGLPSEDGKAMKRWADAAVDLLSGVAPPERMLEAWQEVVELLDYLRGRLAAPAPESVTADVADAVARGDLSDREGVSMMLQLVIAGSESTASLMGSAARILAERQDLQTSLRHEPGRIATFLEETLRIESPFRGHFRVTTQDTELGGVRLPAGARVMLMWGAANRDGDAFEAPDDVDLERAHPKAHVAFGSGIHMCVGAPLARLEARIAIGTLLDRTTSFTLAAPVKHIPSLFVRRLESLQLLTQR